MTEEERVLRATGVIPSAKTLTEVAGGLTEGFKVGDTLRIRVASVDDLRPTLAIFACKCEEKLKKNDHKRGWRELPVEALFRLMLIEVDEFKVAREFLTVADARDELVDIANFAMMLWDRLSGEDQTMKVGK